MLKIKNLIFAISLSPLLSIAWQLPNQAQSFNRSSTTAGGNSGANTGASQTTIFSVPSTTGGQTGGTTTATTPTGTIVNIPIIFGISTNITNGVSTIGNLVAGNTVQISVAKTELNSSNITVIDGTTENTVFISVPPAVQSTVNQLATTIIRNLISTTNGKDIPPVVVLMNGGTGSQEAAIFVTNSLTAAGISLEKAQAIVQALNGLFASSLPTASLPNLPVAQTTLGQLTASTKVLKPVSVIAQVDTAPNVNINKLNDSIVGYDNIILEGKPEDMEKIYQNPDFVLIGQILRQLKTEIK